MSPRRSHLRLRTRAHSRTHSHSPGAAATRPPRGEEGRAGGGVAGGSAGRGRAARGSGRLHGEPPAGGRGRREGRAWRGVAAGMETCFGWLRVTTRGFTSSQSNFGAAVQDRRAAARGGLGHGARAAGCRDPAGGPPSVGRGEGGGPGARRAEAGPHGARRASAGVGRAGWGTRVRWFSRRRPAGRAGERGGEGSLRVGGAEFPEGESVPARAGSAAGSLALLPLAAHRLGGGPRTFLRLAVSPGAVAAGAEGRSREPWRRREEGCPRRGCVAGRKGGCGRDAGREPLGWVVGDTGGNFGGTREDVGEPGCHGRGTLRSRLVGC